MTSRNRLFAKLGKDIDTDGNITSDGLAAGVGGAVTIFSARADLPTSGNTAGDQAYVTANNRLYIWNGSGWYNIALLNVAPSISSVADSAGNTTPFALSDAGTTTKITITATDSDGDPLTFNASADSAFNGLGTLSQSDNLFTITPKSQDSATTSSGTITFTATDGVNTASSGVQTFTLLFIAPQWKSTVMSLDTSGTNDATNNTFTDRSSSTHTISSTGGAVQNSFHPYLTNWSTYFGNDDNSSVVFGNLSASDELGTGAFTIEAWVNPLNLTNNGGIINYGNYTAGLMLRVGSSSQLFYNSTSQNITMPAIGVWSHICVERDGSNNWAWYINGVQEDTWTSSTSITGSGNALQIGRNNHNASEDFYGWISNVRVVKGSRVYGSAFTPPTENLIAVSGTTFLGMQNNRWKDNSSSARAVSAVNAGCKIEAYNPFGQGSEYNVTENKGSLLLNGNSDSQGIQAAASSEFAFGTGDFTIEFWGYWTDFSETYGGIDNYDTIYGHDNESATPQIWFNASGKITYTEGGIGSDYIASSIDINESEWTHFALVRNSGTTTMYINGVSAGTYSDSRNYSGTSNAVAFGYRPTVGRGNVGYFSDLRVCKGTAIYTSAFTPPTSPVGNTNANLYLPFDNPGIFEKSGRNTYLRLSGNTAVKTAVKKYDTSSIYYDGTGDYIKMEVPPIRQQNYTMEAWIYPTSVSGYRRIMGTQTDSVVPSTGYMFRLNGNQLQFSSKRISKTILKVLNAAVANAENNKQLDIDKLFIKEAFVGKSLRMKRWRPRAKGRAASIIKPFSKVTIVVEERTKTKKEIK